MKVFILGPMAGIKGFNFDRFDAAELYLIENGMVPVNPAHFRREKMLINPHEYPNGSFDDRGFPPDRAAKYAAMGMQYDMDAMMGCEMVAMLPECEDAFQNGTAVFPIQLKLADIARATGKSLIELHPCAINTKKLPRKEPPAAGLAVIPLPTPPAAPAREAA